MSRRPRCRGKTRCWVCCPSFCSPFCMVAVNGTRLLVGCSRSHLQPPYRRWSKEIGGDSAAVIHGSDRDVPLWSSSRGSSKATHLYEWPLRQSYPKEIS